MKQLLNAYAAYDLWANEKLLNLALTLDPETQTRTIVSSFPSLLQTFLHLWDASSIWWQRLQLKEQVLVPSLTFHPDMRDVAHGLIQQNKQWLAWVTEADDNTLCALLHYRNMKGDRFSQPVNDILLHLFNHGSYHRGQAITILRQLGVEQIPQTDYIVFCRNVKA